jgi:hypothetical protein
MLLLLSISMCVVGTAWYMANADAFFVSLFVAILSATVHDMYECSHDTFLRDSLSKLKKTPCCIFSESFNDPLYVLRWTIALRCLTGILAATSVLISWYFKGSFATGHYLVVSGSWCVVCVCWILSCVPLIISLMQCAAVTDSKTAVQYRKVVFVWILHDIFLGLFWLYLSLMLYDLADDNDDSEWRTIFLSMLSWHIIILILHRIYMKGTRESNYHSHKCSTCCGPNTKSTWLDIFLLLSFLCIYRTVIVRLQRNNLISMGMSETYIALYVAAIALAYFCKTRLKQITMDGKKDDNIGLKKLVHGNGTNELYGSSELSF